MNLRHQIVHFRLADIYFPEPSSIALRLHDGDEVEGEVIDLSDRGEEKEAFAVIKIERVSQAVLVPVDRLHSASSTR